jgi:carnitine O-acetyltransferase
LWHGDVVNGIPVGLRNRWVDKPLQFIVFDNGYAGFMGEHSVMDGTPTARMCDDVLNMLYDPSFDHGSPSGIVALPIPLDWELSPTTTLAIANADRAAVELIESHELGYYLTSYGKDAIKKFGVSPDFWSQMIIQLAYRRLLGAKRRNGGTYEATMTRKFFKGRTETIRVVTSESDAWAKSMDDKNATPALRKQLFDQAMKKHIILAKEAGEGQGVDRHLFGKGPESQQLFPPQYQLFISGLKKLLKDEEPPELFQDPVFRRSSSWVLSTSAIFSKHFPVYGWGEVDSIHFSPRFRMNVDFRLSRMVLG